MKRPISLFCLLLSLAGVIMTAKAQAPQKFSFQAVVRNSTNALVANSPVGIRVSILQGSATGASVYTETHTQSTNANGLVTFEIGNGTVVSGNFGTVDWPSGTYFIKTETDPTGGSSYTIAGTQQLLSVPYAQLANASLSAQTVASVNATAISGLIPDDKLSEHLQDLADGTLTGSKVGAGINAANISAGTFPASSIPNLDASKITTGIMSDSRLNTHLQDLADGTLTGSKIGTGIDASNITVGTLPIARIADNAIGSSNIIDGTIASVDIADGSITSAKISDGTIASIDIADGSVTSAKIFNGTITDLDLHINAAIQDSKLMNIATPGKVSGNAITSGTIAGSTNINTTGTISATSFNGKLLYPYGSVFLGYQAGNNSTSTFPVEQVGVGYQALYSASSNSFNTAVGCQALYSSLSLGSHNTALGYQALYANTTGNENSAQGFRALWSNTTGAYNSAVGYQALLNNTTGQSNTAFGRYALRANVNGSSNTAVGMGAGMSISASGGNTLIGYSAGSGITTGANNTVIGNGAQASTAIISNQITLGNSSVTSLRCNVQTISSLSDRRDKKNIQDLSLGLEFIKQLKPRQFQWDRREWYDNEVTNGSKMQNAPTAGFIAQELDEVQTEFGAEWLNLVLKDNPEKWEATYGNLLPAMVKAIQEQQEQIEELKLAYQVLKESVVAQKLLIKDGLLSSSTSVKTNQQRIKIWQFRR